MVTTTEAKEYTEVIAYTDAGLTEYLGRAAPGTATTSTGWQIKKLTYSGTSVVSITWADGTTQFDKVWSSRATYSYS